MITIFVSTWIVICALVWLATRNYFEQKLTVDYHWRMDYTFLVAYSISAATALLFIN